MIVERYDPMNLFELVPKLVADFEPELRELDRLLDDDAILQRIKADLARRAPHSLTRGRHSTPVEVILRLFVVKRLYKWSYEATEHFVGDSLVLRQFCRISLQPVPDDTTLIRWAKLIGPDTLQQINDRVVELATQLKVTRGRKLRGRPLGTAPWSKPISITRLIVRSSAMVCVFSAACSTRPKPCSARPPM